MITYLDVSENFQYKDGSLYWKISKGPAKKGQRAGTLNRTGYRNIFFNRRCYREHRLIWLLFNGYFPEGDIDHINRVKDDNRIENLREISRFCNQLNCNIAKNNRTGITGVKLLPDGRYLASISDKGKKIHLHVSRDLTEAVAHRAAAEEFLGVDQLTMTPAHIFIQKYKEEEHEHTK